MTTAVRPGELTYALVTPARNEAAFIEQTLRSVVRQTHRPTRWIIVDDGSTDETPAIVQRYARSHAWIEVLSLSRPEGRSFASKARAFNTGYLKLRAGHDAVIGNLDADLSVDAEYFAYLLAKFVAFPRLGVAGAAMIEEGASRYDYRFTNIEHVSGGCQLFRRECLDAIGGYVLADKGIDTIAVTTARMLGWQTRTFVEKAWVHHRPMDSRRGPLERWVRIGEKDYLLGNSWVWQLARGVYQMTRPPLALRGAAIVAGYATASIRGRERLVSADLRRYLRTERTQRIRRAVAWMGRVRHRPATLPEDAALSIGESLFRLGAWVEAHDYKAYEPFDGLSSYLRPLTLGVPILERGLQQLGRRSPINLRPLLGIRPLESTKGRGYMARGYLARWRDTGEDEYRDRAVACLDWLIEHRSPRSQEFSWGNHFDFASRAGRYRKQEPIIVWTSLIGQAFLDAYEDLGTARYLDVARSVCDWILALPRERTPAGSCLSYLADRQLSIHNANLLGAAVLARTAKHTGRTDLIDVARDAVRYTCAAQRPDGAWYYGEAPIYHWIDSFHTGYNLDSLHAYGGATGDTAFTPHFERGLRFFRERLFERDGTPKSYHDRTYPVDIQCAAQAIETFSMVSACDAGALADASRVARWTVRHMQDPSGYFYYRRSPRFISRIPMLHWGQATMYRALALLSLKLAERESGAGERAAVESA